MNIAILLQRAALRAPDKTAVYVGPRPHASYAELAGSAAAIAGYLRDELGLAPGDRVAMAMKNCPEFLEVLYGIIHAGLCAVPMNAKLHPREFAYILENSGARHCFATADLADALAPLADEIVGLDGVVSVADPAFAGMKGAAPIPVTDRDPTDLAWLFYTSGTTGQPKGAMLSHRSLLAMTHGFFSDVADFGPDDTLIHAAPMSHGSGCCNFVHVAKAAAQVISERSSFEPDEIFDLLRTHRNVNMFAAPTMVKRMVDDACAREVDSANLKTVIYGGGPMYVEDIKQALAIFGDKFVQIFGQGESPMTITALPRELHMDRDHPRYEERLASVGFAQTGVEVRVVDDDDNDLPVGEVGEILVRGDVIMNGYWDNPEATAETMRGGWVHTGDMGCFDAEGFLTLKDRSKDMIISGGTNIYPREVEETLLTHPDVSEVSVVGRPHPEWGEEVVAFVVAAPGAEVTESALDAHCRERIARFKRPRAYVFVDALPKNNYGKVLKTELRARLEGAA